MLFKKIKKKEREKVPKAGSIKVVTLSKPRDEINLKHTQTGNVSLFFAMKIQCIGNNVFICRTRQLKILFNCPLETKTLNKLQEQQQEETRSDLSFILSRYFSEQGKRATDTQYSSVTSAINNCDEQTMFRIPDFRLIDIHTIDLVVIANSECMLGLPYLTEYMGYKGKIIATEPTIEFAK
jgi:integrator complex subunit 9